MTGYSKVSIPYLKNHNKTLDVLTSITVLNIGNLNTEEMTFEVEVYFDMKWMDPRLAFKEYLNASYVLVPGETAYQHIWVPDLFIRNMKFSESSTFLTDLSGVIIYPDGFVTLSSRMRVVAHCEMDLLMFPLDSQSCNLMIVSFNYDTTVLRSLWGENPVAVDTMRDGRKSQIDTWMGLKLVETLTTEGSYVYQNSGLKFQYLIATFVLERQTQYYILKGFIPSSLLVCLTWASFWLPTTSYPARVALILTSFLASIVLYQGSSLHINQMTVMQVFLLGNIALIGLTLLEYLLAVKKEHQIVKMKSIVNQTKGAKVKGVLAHNKKKMVNPVDQKARYIIPLIYMVFIVTFVISVTMLSGK
uniref:Neurotransmitter-gated ion-channel ligand-binding domain-containing protein n=2 Tax=Clytia hemisphaerica TaxID=252671 RepID=A0A7M5WX17_9CNID